jgi:hypothetical protein
VDRLQRTYSIGIGPHDTTNSFNQYALLTAARQRAHTAKTLKHAYLGLATAISIQPHPDPNQAPHPMPEPLVLNPLTLSVTKSTIGSQPIALPLHTSAPLLIAASALAPDTATFDLAGDMRPPWREVLTDPPALPPLLLVFRACCCSWVPRESNLRLAASRSCANCFSSCFRSSALPACKWEKQRGHTRLYPWIISLWESGNSRARVSPRIPSLKPYSTVHGTRDSCRLLAYASSYTGKSYTT